MKGRDWERAEDDGGYQPSKSSSITTDKSAEMGRAEQKLIDCCRIDLAHVLRPLVGNCSWKGGGCRFTWTISPDIYVAVHLER